MGRIQLDHDRVPVGVERRSDFEGVQQGGDGNKERSVGENSSGTDPVGGRVRVVILYVQRVMAYVPSSPPED